MAELSQYEKDRAKNIERNQAHLASLGIFDLKIPKSEPRAPKQRSFEPLSLEPTRTSSRLAGKEVDYTYAESARFLDEIDRDEDFRMRKKRGRPTRAPERYDGADYEQPRRKRTVTNRPDPGQQHAALVARLPPQPATMPSRQKIIELRQAGVTEEQLAAANYPQETRDAYKDLLIKYPFSPTGPTCDYDLMPFDLYLSDYSGKFKVQCAKCEEYYCLNKQGKIHLHSRCEQIAKTKKEEALKTAAGAAGANDS